MTSRPVRVMDFRGTYKGGGGPDKTILNSAAQHDSSLVYVLVVYLKQPDDKEFKIPAAAKLLAINYVDLNDHCIFDLGCIRQLKKLIHQNEISLLHSHDDKTLLYSVTLKYLIPGLRIMHTCHSHSEYAKESFKGLKNYWKFCLRKKILIFLMQQHQKPVLTISENTRQRLIRAGLDQKNVTVLYNGIDLAYWKRADATPILREELNLNNYDLLVGTVARITYDKDLPTFFRVAANVNKQLPHVKFVIVGDGFGEELLQVKNDVKASGLENIIFFTGHRTDLLDIYSSFDIFLMTSLTEGLPNTMLEAMAMEVPVVSTAVGGVPELIVTQETGLLCPVGDVSALSTAVSSLITDPHYRKKMAQKSRKRVESKFNFTKRVQLLEDIYLSFLSEDHEYL